jgi:hypothetical protein
MDKEKMESIESKQTNENKAQSLKLMPLQCNSLTIGEISLSSSSLSMCELVGWLIELLKNSEVKDYLDVFKQHKQIINSAAIG